MATGTIAITTCTIAGTTDLLGGAVGQIPTATDGDYLATTGYELAFWYNGSGAPVTVTIDAYPSGGQGAPLSLTVTDPTVTVAAGAVKLFGPFPKTVFGNASNNVKITGSAITDCKVGAIKLVPTP